LFKKIGSEINLYQSVTFSFFNLSIKFRAEKTTMKDYQLFLFPYAYNILGSSENAKDAVQDVLLKFFSIKNTSIENEKGYLIKSVINQAINIKKKQQRQVENNIWLPEPISTENPQNNIEQEEILSYSLLVLLEKVTPKERAVYILKEAFDYSHKEIASVFDLTIENSRKILSRAKAKITPSKSDLIRENGWGKLNYLEKYIRVIRAGEMKQLEKMLSDDIQLAADGGVGIKVVRELTIGKIPTRDLLIFVFQTYLESKRVEISTVNHQPALLYYEGDTLINCQVFEIWLEKLS